MGFLDRAKKLAEQAMTELKEQTAKARHPSPTGAGAGGAPPAADPRFGTPYREGMLGRPGWREHDLIDPAAILPVKARDGAGIPHSTKSEIVAEPYGVGRRWTSGRRAAGLFYRLDPDHRAWTSSTLEDGRSLVFLDDVVLEVKGLDEGAVADLTTAVRRAMTEA